ncbi:unnamed protein product, partial [Ectocarpus sp. 12 AP-2014]
LDFNDVSIFRVGGQTVSDAMLPVGHLDSSLGPLQVSRKPSTGTWCIETFTTMPTTRAQELLNSNAAGFVYVTEVDMDKRRLAVLSPCPGSLPSRFLIAGTVKWQE